MATAAPTTPRLLLRSQLLAYLQITWAEAKQRMVTGRLPKPIWGVEAEDKTARWDRRAVDRALDAASALPATLEEDERSLDRALGL